MQLCNLSFYHWLFCCDSLCKYGFSIISMHTIKTMSTTLRFQLICVYIPYCKFEIATVIIIDYNQFERSPRIDALSHHIRPSHARLPTDATSPPPLSSSRTFTFFLSSVCHTLSLSFFFHCLLKNVILSCSLSACMYVCLFIIFLFSFIISLLHSLLLLHHPSVSPTLLLSGMIYPQWRVPTAPVEGVWEGQRKSSTLGQRSRV